MSSWIERSSAGHRRSPVAIDDRDRPDRHPDPRVCPRVLARRLGQQEAETEDQHDSSQHPAPRRCDQDGSTAGAELTRTDRRAARFGRLGRRRPVAPERRRRRAPRPGCGCQRGVRRRPDRSTHEPNACHVGTTVEGNGPNYRDEWVNQLRLDPLSGRWIAVSTERQRSATFTPRQGPRIADHDTCPFGPGGEEGSPPSLELSGDDGEWRGPGRPEPVPRVLRGSAVRRRSPRPSLHRSAGVGDSRGARLLARPRADLGGLHR